MVYVWKPSFLNYEMRVWGEEKMHLMGFPGGTSGKEPDCKCRTQTLGWEDPLQEGMATHSIIIAWRVPWTEDPGRL